MPLAVCFLIVLAILDHLGVSFLHPTLKPELASLVGQEVTLEGILVEPVEIRPRNSKATVALPQTKILLTLPSVPDWERGDRIRFETRPKRPKHYKNPGSFDYRRYLERKGILLTGFVENPEEAEKIEKKSSSLAFVDRLRGRLSKILKKEIRDPEAGFLSALVVGDRAGMSDDLWNDFRRTGTAHLIAISGQHIAMIGVAFYAFFLWLLKRSERLLLSVSVRKLSGILTLIPICFYTVLAGAPPSAVRAAIVAGFIFLAPLVGREIDILSALAAAAIGISLFDSSAPFSASFQLSFLAVLGIWVFQPRGGVSQGKASLAPTVIKKYLVNPFWMTLGATLTTAPLVAYLFHQVSLSGLLTNLWAIPATGLLLIVTGASLTIALILPLLGHWLLSFCDYLAHLFLSAIHLSSRFSWTISFYPTESELLLAFLFVAAIAIMKWKPHRWRPAGIAAAVVLGIWSFPSCPFWERDLEVTFLDVGQGDAALILTPSGKSLLIDGGGFLIPGKGPPLFDIGSEVVVPYLRRRGLEKIDRVLLSHPHPDHYGGLTAVLESFPVGEFWRNGQTFPDETFEHLLETARRKGIPEKILRKGDRFDWEGLKVEVLYPSRIDSGKNINDNSLVVRISSGEARFLFPGDIEKWGEESLQDDDSIRSTILKIPHHASRTSSSVPFIDTVHPEYAVASLGEDNFFGFPHPGVLEKYERRSVKVYRTDRDGAVTFRVPRGFPRRSISIRTFSSGE